MKATLQVPLRPQLSVPVGLERVLMTATSKNSENVGLRRSADLPSWAETLAFAVMTVCVCVSPSGAFIEDLAGRASAFRARATVLQGSSGNLSHRKQQDARHSICWPPCLLLVHQASEAAFAHGKYPLCCPAAQTRQRGRAGGLVGEFRSGLRGRGR